MLLCSKIALNATKVQFCRPVFKIAKLPLHFLEKNLV